MKKFTPNYKVTPKKCFKYGFIATIDKYDIHRKFSIVILADNKRNPLCIRNLKLCIQIMKTMIMLFQVMFKECKPWPNTSQNFTKLNNKYLKTVAVLK